MLHRFWNHLSLHAVLMLAIAGYLSPLSLLSLDLCLSLLFSSSFSCQGCLDRSACALSCVFTQSHSDSEVWLGRETVARWSEMWAGEELLCFSVPLTTSFFSFSFYVHLFRKYCCMDPLEVMTIIERL